MKNFCFLCVMMFFCVFFAKSQEKAGHFYGKNAIVNPADSSRTRPSLRKFYAIPAISFKNLADSIGVAYQKNDEKMVYLVPKTNSPQRHLRMTESNKNIDPKMVYRYKEQYFVNEMPKVIFNSADDE